MTDHGWVAVQIAVLDGLKGTDVMGQPPRDDQELDRVADTVADHVIGAIDHATRRILANDERHR